MECDDNGRECGAPAASGCRGVQRQRVAGAARGLQLVFPLKARGARAGRPLHAVLAGAPASTAATPDRPFVSNMDEISYWVYTKRAPCLFNYDNVLKKQAEQAQCSKATPASGNSINEEVPSPNKKKRKIKLLDDDSMSTEKPQNVYFETPQSQNQKTAGSSCKSDIIGSNVDFNIKKSSIQNKSKRIKLQKNNQSPKKNKAVTSTPIVTNLRRSLRKAQQQNTNGEPNISFDIFNDKEEIGEQHQSRSEKLAGGDQNKSKISLPAPEKEVVVQNGQFEDLSDVSGFTANYIRSTKMNASKTPRKLRSRNSRTLIKNNKDSGHRDDKMVMCVNKSVNTGAAEANVLNCSTDSSQNVINLVTVKNNGRSSRVNRSTSLLKIMDSKLDNFGDDDPNNQVDDSGNKTQMNISFQSKSSGTSRYPKRYRNTAKVTDVDNNHKSSQRQRNCKRINKLDDSDRKENSEERIITRTRSRTKLLNVDQKSDKIDLNYGMDRSGSAVALNVASPARKDTRQGNTPTSRCLRSRRCKDKSALYKDYVSDESDGKVAEEVNSPLVKSTPRRLGRLEKSTERTGRSLGKDDPRNRSGFAACFSDSGSDNEPLKTRKFFC